jgi:hypothetical protein
VGEQAHWSALRDRLSLTDLAVLPDDADAPVLAALQLDAAVLPDTTFKPKISQWIELARIRGVRWYRYSSASSLADAGFRT